MSLTSCACLWISSLACWSAVCSMVPKMTSSKYKSTVSWWTCTTCDTAQALKRAASYTQTLFLHTIIHVHTCLKISSSSLRLRSSTCLLPLSSASRRRRSLSARSVKAWILRSSWRWISSLDKASNRCSSSAPTTLAWDASSWEVWAGRKVAWWDW